MHLVLDYDGVIADSMVFIIEVLNSIANEMKISKIDSEAIRYWKKNGPMLAFKKYRISPSKVPYITRRMVEIQEKEEGKVKYFRGMKTVLKKINKAGIGLGIITSNEKNNVKKNLIYNNLDIFEFIEGGIKFFGKAATIKKVKNRIGDMIYVGDETRDIEACKKAGVPIIAVSWGFNDKALLKDADYVVDSPTEFLNLVLRLNQ